MSRGRISPWYSILSVVIREYQKGTGLIIGVNFIIVKWIYLHSDSSGFQVEMRGRVVNGDCKWRHSKAARPTDCLLQPVLVGPNNYRRPGPSTSLSLRTAIKRWLVYRLHVMFRVTSIQVIAAPIRRQTPLYEFHRGLWKLSGFLACRLSSLH